MLTLLLLSSFALAEEDSVWDDDDSGFDATEAEEVVITARSKWSYGGFLRSQAALWANRLDDDALAMARQTGKLWTRYSGDTWRFHASLQAEVDPVYLLDDTADAATKEAYGWYVQPRELWVSRDIGTTEVAFGRQVVTWGEGTILSPLDKVNARDARDPGMADLDTLKIPVTMLRNTTFLGKHRFEILTVIESDYGQRGSPEGPFGAVPTMIQTAEIAPALLDEISRDELLEMFDTSWTDVEPRFSATLPQFFGRMLFRFNNVDLGLYAASLLDKSGVLTNPDLGEYDALDEIIADGNPFALQLPFAHPRYTLVGQSTALAVGAFVLRSEFTAELNKEVNLGTFINDSYEFNSIRLAGNIYTVMGGVTYTPSMSTRLDIEASKGFAPDILINSTLPLDTLQYAVRASQKMMKDRLELTGMFLGIGSTLQLGSAAGISADLEISDGLRATLGYIMYSPGESLGPLYGLSEHDRVFGTIKRAF
jgi:hypothetical protein